MDISNELPHRSGMVANRGKGARTGIHLCKTSAIAPQSCPQLPKQLSDFFGHFVAFIADQVNHTLNVLLKNYNRLRSFGVILAEDVNAGLNDNEGAQEGFLSRAFRLRERGNGAEE